MEHGTSGFERAGSPDGGIPVSTVVHGHVLAPWNDRPEIIGASGGASVSAGAWARAYTRGAQQQCEGEKRGGLGSEPGGGLARRGGCPRRGGGGAPARAPRPPRA